MGIALSSVFLFAHLNRTVLLASTPVSPLHLNTGFCLICIGSGAGGAHGGRARGTRTGTCTGDVHGARPAADRRRTHASKPDDKAARCSGSSASITFLHSCAAADSLRASFDGCMTMWMAVREASPRY